MNQYLQNTGYVKTDDITANYGIERLIISGVINSIFGLAVLVGLKSLGIPMLVAILLALFLAIVGVVLLTKRLPSELIGIRKRKPWVSTIWLLIALVAFLQTTRLSIFMIDSSQTQHSLFPGDQWMIEHCCLTAYSESAKFVGEGEKNIYRKDLYFGAEFLNNKEFRRKLDGFNVDPYHYPPPFLLLPTMARAAVGGDFLNLRMLWFAMSVLSLMTAIGFMIFRLEPAGRMRLIGMAPLIWCSLPVLAGLQMSNVQIIVISISIIAMALFSINRPIGGLLLAMSTVAKIFPGILIVYLIAQKKFREVGWVAGFAILLSIIAFIAVGPNPFLAFIEFELPQLSSGEAFSGPFSKVFAVARNMAPFGIPLKLGWLGVPGMTLEIGRIVSAVHLLMVVLLAIWSGRRKLHSNTEEVSVWIALISLGSLVSPFAPANYVLVSVILLICLNREFFPVWVAIIIWLIICVPFLIPRDASFLIQALCFIPAQVISIAAPAFVLYQAGIITIEQKNIMSETNLAAETSTDI
jgi:hypothetical protein